MFNLVQSEINDIFNSLTQNLHVGILFSCQITYFLKTRLRVLLQHSPKLNVYFTLFHMLNIKTYRFNKLPQDF